MSSIDSIGGRFVFNGSRRTIPGLGTGIVSPKNVALSQLAYIATCDFPLGRSNEKRNRELLSQESFSRCSSFPRSKMSSLS